MNDRLETFLREKARAAGRQYADAQRIYRNAKTAASANIPSDEQGDARIVCRRYADRRTVSFDEEGRPACFDPDHQDCQGCLEDIREGRIETW